MKPSSVVCWFGALAGCGRGSLGSPNQEQKEWQQHSQPEPPLDTARTTQTGGRRARPRCPPGTGHHSGGGCSPWHQNLEPAAGERTRTQKERKSVRLQQSITFPEK